MDVLVYRALDHKQECWTDTQVQKRVGSTIQTLPSQATAKLQHQGWRKASGQIAAGKKIATGNMMTSAGKHQH